MQSRIALLIFLGLGAAVLSAPLSHPKNASRSDFEPKDCYHYQCVNLVNHVLYTSCTDGVHSTGAVTVSGLYQLMPWASDCAGHGYGLIDCGNKYYAWSPDLPPTWDCGCHPCLVHGCGCESAVSESDPLDEVTPIHSDPVPPPSTTDEDDDSTSVDGGDDDDVEIDLPKPAHARRHHKPGQHDKPHNKKPNSKHHKKPNKHQHPKKEDNEEQDKPAKKHHKKQHKKHHDNDEQQQQELPKQHNNKPHRRHPKRGDVPPIATDPVIEQPLPEPIPQPTPEPEPHPVELPCSCNEGSESCSTGCYINGSGDEEVIRSDAGTGRRCGNLSANEHFIITAVDGCSCQGHKLGASFDPGCSWVYCHVLHRSTC